ncbi:MFS transporter [Biscogniauxia sp. FL1348]|nr:MFS transporter [Biscogniauxia sp. FL1348]
MDETQPLLQETSLLFNEQRDELSRKDIVDFARDGDVDNPIEWPKAYKWGIVSLLAFMSFTVTFTCISVVPIANRIVDDLDGGHASKSASVLLVTIWELGEAAGPLLIAPLSEVFGRYPVMNVANVLFIGAIGLSALSQSTPLLVAARALTGLAVASNVLNPAIVGDMFISEQRGSPMSIVMLAPLVGGAVGPAISGAVAESLGWRQVVWMSALLATVCELGLLTCFRETYKVAILKHRAKKLRRETGNASLRTAFEDSDESSSKKLWSYVMRPAIVLAGSGVLQALSIFGSIVFTYYYIMSTTLASILEDLYHQSPTEAGFSFIAFSVGSVISVTFCNLFLDRIYIKLRDAHGGKGKPEYRLPVVIVGAFTLPFAIALYGWTAHLRLSLGLLTFSVVLIGTTLMLSFLPFYAYVVDAFGIYAASGMTAVIVLRCLMGTFLPLTTAPLVERFGYGLAFTILASFGLLIAPIPVLVFRYGSVWRQRSKYTREE